MNNPVKSAARVLDLLELFALAREPLGVSEVARQLGMPKSSAQALLATLVARGYLARMGSAYQLAASVRSGELIGGPFARLTRLAEPVMQRMAERSGESAFLGVLTGDWQVRYVAKAVSSNQVRYDADLAHLRPAYCTSIGLAILAHRHAADIETFLRRVPLKRITPQTITDRAALRRVIEKAQRDGYAEVRDGHVSGASGVSAPIFAPDATAIAALNLGAPSVRYGKVRARLITIVLSGAQELTQALGMLGPRATMQRGAALRIAAGGR